MSSYIGKKHFRHKGDGLRTASQCQMILLRRTTDVQRPSALSDGREPRSSWRAASGYDIDTVPASVGARERYVCERFRRRLIVFCEGNEAVEMPEDPVVKM